MTGQAPTSRGAELHAAYEKSLRQDALEAAVSCWRTPKTSQIEMDRDLADAFADLLIWKGQSHMADMKALRSELEAALNHVDEAVEGQEELRLDLKEAEAENTQAMAALWRVHLVSEKQIDNAQLKAALCSEGFPDAKSLLERDQQICNLEEAKKSLEAEVAQLKALSMIQEVHEVAPLEVNRLPEWLEDNPPSSTPSFIRAPLDPANIKSKDPRTQWEGLPRAAEEKERRASPSNLGGYWLDGQGLEGRITAAEGRLARFQKEHEALRAELGSATSRAEQAEKDLDGVRQVNSDLRKAISQLTTTMHDNLKRSSELTRAAEQVLQEAGL